MKTYTLNHPFTSAAGALLLSIVAFTSGISAATLLGHSSSQQTAAAATVLFPAPVTLGNNQLIAKAAVLYDPQDGRILYSKNSETQLPLASLTKLMTATAVLQNNPTNKTVSITVDDLKPDGDWGFKEGDHIPLSDLLRMGLIASSNDAMAAAAATLGGNSLQTINTTAKKLGLSHMYFLNPTGLDESTTTAGAYGSAFDVAKLAALFYNKYPQYFELTTAGSVSIRDGSRTLSAAATAVPLGDVPGLIGAKTGYTDLAGGNLVAIFDLEVGHPVVAVVLGSTEEGRFTDIKTLIQAARAGASTPI